MAKRNKRLKKQILGLERQIKIHQNKILNERGRKDTTHSYWIGEIEKKFNPQLIQRKNKLLRKKKH